MACDSACVDDRDLVACVNRSLVKRRIESESLGAFHFKVHAFDAGDDVRRIISAAELAAAAGIHAEEPSDFRRGLPFTTFAFVARAKSHTRTSEVMVV